MKSNFLLETRKKKKPKEKRCKKEGGFLKNKFLLWQILSSKVHKATENKVEGCGYKTKQLSNERGVKEGSRKEERTND